MHFLHTCFCAWTLGTAFIFGVQGTIGLLCFLLGVRPRHPWSHPLALAAFGFLGVIGAFVYDDRIPALPVAPVAIAGFVGYLWLMGRITGVRVFDRSARREAARRARFRR